MRSPSPNMEYGVGAGFCFYDYFTFVNSYPTFLLNSKQFVSSSKMQLIPDINYPKRVYVFFFSLALLFFNPKRLEDKCWSILAWEGEAFLIKDSG